MRNSIRYQIMALIGAIVVGALGVYLVLATSLFTSDKVAYLYDFNSHLVGTVAEEVHIHLASQVDRLRFFGAAAETGDPAKAARALFESDEGLLGVEVYRRQGYGYVKVFGIEDAGRLAGRNLTATDLLDARQEHPAPFDVISAEQVFLWNASLPPDLALARLGTASASGDQIVIADLVPERLLRVFERPRLGKVYLVDHRGRLVVHPDAAPLLSHADLSGHPLVQAALGSPSARAVKEVELPEGTVIGAYAAVPLSRLSVLIEVPKALALEATRELTRRSVLFALFVLSIALLASIFFARRIAAPLQHLEEKMEVISRGEFGVEVAVRDNNEIGRLAGAFNRMSRELRSREAALSEAHAQLVQSEKLSALGEMSAGLAHEVKNPMVGIVGFSELGQMTKSIDEAHEFFELIRADAARANDILQNLLEFARPQKVEVMPLEVNEVVERAIRLVAHQLAINGVKLERAFTDGLPRVTGNENQLRQVLVNLMMNAAHAMAQSPEKLLRLSTTRLEGGVVLEVRDTGAGMSEEVRRNLFRPFFTTKAPGKGTGLGLSVSRSIVMQHGGDLMVDSAPGRGATFRIRLPGLVDEAKPAEGAAAASATGGGTAAAN